MLAILTTVAMLSALAVAWHWLELNREDTLLLSGSIALLWIMPLGALVVGPVVLLLSFASPRGRDDWKTNTKPRLFAVSMIVVILLGSGFLPISTPTAPTDWGDPELVENPNADFWPASEQYSWWVPSEGAVVTVIHVRMPHQYSPFALESTSLWLADVLGKDDQRLNQAIDLLNSQLGFRLLNPEDFHLREVATAPTFEYGDEELSIVHQRVVIDLGSIEILDVMTAARAGWGGELQLISVLRSVGTSENDPMAEKLISDWLAVN